MKLNNIIKSKVKEFIIVFGEALGEILIMSFIVSFAVIPCLIIKQPYFIILWITFISSLYVAIWNVFLINLELNKYNYLKYESRIYN